MKTISTWTIFRLSTWKATLSDAEIRAYASSKRTSLTVFQPVTILDCCNVILNPHWGINNVVVASFKLKSKNEETVKGQLRAGVEPNTSGFKGQLSTIGLQPLLSSTFVLNL